MIIAGQGQIAQMKLPDGWLESADDTPPGALVGARSMREFVSPDTDARLCFYYRGGPISTAAADNFVKLLSQPTHLLTEDEYLSLAEILENASYPGAFSKETAQSIDISGKRVLAIEGFWNASKKRSLLLMIDADGSGRFVQEIFYDAPEADYAKYIDAVRLSINSITWV